MNIKQLKYSLVAFTLASSFNSQSAQVFVTDLVVQGSACLGFDCVNGESFGFDTLRLKENNLRIHFQDTSSSGSFPSRDWRIVINDTTNGGSNFFAIEDSDAGTYPFRVMAGAGNNALYVDAQGDVGLNTSNPVVELHISDGDTPTMRLEQSGASGWTPQTWDIAGNETNFFIRDVTNGSKLPFKIRPSAPDNSIYVNTNGDIGLGTSSPSAALDIENGDLEIKDGQLRIGGISGQKVLATGVETLMSVTSKPGKHALMQINTTDSNYVSQLHFSHANQDNWILSSRSNVDGLVSDRMGLFNSNVQEVFTVHQNGALNIGQVAPNLRDDTNPISVGNGAYLSTGGVWTNASSRSLKEHISALDTNAAIAALSSLAPVTYNYLNSPEEQYVGFIAEDVPTLVATKDRKSLSPMDIVAVLTKVVQEQQKQIEALNKLNNKSK